MTLVCDLTVGSCVGKGELSCLQLSVRLEFGWLLTCVFETAARCVIGKSSQKY